VKLRHDQQTKTLKLTRAQSLSGRWRALALRHNPAQAVETARGCPQLASSAHARPAFGEPVGSGPIGISRPAFPEAAWPSHMATHTVELFTDQYSLIRVAMCISLWEITRLRAWVMGACGSAVTEARPVAQQDKVEMKLHSAAIGHPCRCVVRESHARDSQLQRSCSLNIPGTGNLNPRSRAKSSKV